MTSDAAWPAYSQEMSSSEHLTTSARATNSSTRARTVSASPMIDGRTFGSYEIVAPRSCPSEGVGDLRLTRLQVVAIDPCACPVPLATARAGGSSGGRRRTRRRRTVETRDRRRRGVRRARAAGKQPDTAGLDVLAAHATVVRAHEGGEPGVVTEASEAERDVRG